MAKKKAPATCCGGPARVGKSIVRNASKSMEKTMIKQATALYENPLKVLPTYDDAESEKGFRKIRKLLEKVNKEKENVKKLEKLAKKRNLAGAVAGTLLIAHAKKAPFLAAAKLPTGIVNYAQRGLAPKEYLIAAQNTDDPLYRIFGIRDIALKYHFHIYSWDNGFVSTGLTAKPPKEFVEYVINTMDYKKEKNCIHCSHLSTQDIEKKQLTTNTYLYLNWHSANLLVGICQQCASKKKNTLFDLTKYLLAEDISEDFTIEVIGSIIKDEKVSSQVETSFIDDYFAGKLTDHRFIEKNMDHRRERLQDSDEKVYILNGENYDSVDSFIEALHPNSWERNALLKLLTLHQKSVIINDATPNDVFTLYWEDYGFDVIKEITQDEEITKEIISLSETPTVMIKTAYEIKKKRDVLQLLPTYSSLPEIAEYADKLARIYRVQGKEKLISTLRSIPNHPKKKAIAYAMLLVIKKQADVKWKFSKIDIESGEFLKPCISALLKGNPEEYHDNLQEVINASGFSESLDSYKK